MNSLSNLALLLGSWANSLPAVWRKRLYKTVKVLAGVATLALIVLPMLPSLGVDLPTNVRWDAVLTAALAFLGHLADSNTHPEPALDTGEAPEPTP